MRFCEQLEIRSRMHTESCPSAKLSGELDVCSAPNNISILEEDLALSSSTLGPQDKSLQDRSDVAPASLYRPRASLIYVNEETMDCSYTEAAIGTPCKPVDSRSEISSPEMFGSDEDEDDEEEKRTCSRSGSPSQRDRKSATPSLENPVQPTREEMIAKSDYYLLARINKFLHGVPPPPKHTICQSDCEDLLNLIRANREYFFLDPLDTPNEAAMCVSPEKIATKTEGGENSPEKTIRDPPSTRSFTNHRGKSSLRNLTNAFDACERNDGTNTTSLSAASTTTTTTTTTTRTTGTPSHEAQPTTENLEIVAKNDVAEVANRLEATSEGVTACEYATNKVRHVTFNVPEREVGKFYESVSVEEARALDFEHAYRHKTHGIYYNRSKAVEDFEGLTLKLCQRYIGAETQSTCNVWFTKQTPGSVKKRGALGRRNNGQSPGKRLSHLARRRRTFSSANLQVLGMADKKQLVLNIKKPMLRKGKSPRGKSPRGKSPRSSAKKRAAMSRISPSPRKTKLETSKRALFQSPPGDRAGPSHATSLINANSQQRIKRALFTNPKSEVTASASNASDIKRALNFEETKKRKSEDDLEGPRYKWAKSLFFDCAHVTESNSSDSWPTERHSTGNFRMKNESTMQQAKSELSETHRKKLLWAVAEALRGKGISMGHPRFKQCASQLARIVKKYMPDLENPNVPRKPGSTSDRMLRLAKRHVLLIVESKSAE